MARLSITKPSNDIIYSHLSPIHRSAKKHSTTMFLTGQMRDIGGMGHIEVDSRPFGYFAH